MRAKVVRPPVGVVESRLFQFRREARFRDEGAVLFALLFFPGFSSASEARPKLKVYGHSARFNVSKERRAANEETQRERLHF